MWKVVAKKCKHESIEERSQHKDTEFVPIPVWLRKEGGGVAAVNGLKFKMAKCQREGTIADHFQLGEETNRVEVSLGRKKKSEGSREKWTLLEESVAAKSNANPPEKAGGVAMFARAVWRYSREIGAGSELRLRHRTKARARAAEMARWHGHAN